MKLQTSNLIDTFRKIADFLEDNPQYTDEISVDENKFIMEIFNRFNFRDHRELEVIISEEEIAAIIKICSI